MGTRRCRRPSVNGAGGECSRSGTVTGDVCGARRPGDSVRRRDAGRFIYVSVFVFVFFAIFFFLPSGFREPPTKGARETITTIAPSRPARRFPVRRTRENLREDSGSRYAGRPRARLVHDDCDDNDNNNIVVIIIAVMTRPDVREFIVRHLPAVAWAGQTFRRDVAKSVKNGCLSSAAKEQTDTVRASFTSGLFFGTSAAADVTYGGSDVSTFPTVFVVRSVSG